MQTHEAQTFRDNMKEARAETHLCASSCLACTAGDPAEKQHECRANWAALQSPKKFSFCCYLVVSSRKVASRRQYGVVGEFYNVIRLSLKVGCPAHVRRLCTLQNRLTFGPLTMMLCPTCMRFSACDILPCKNKCSKTIRVAIRSIKKVSRKRNKGQEERERG